MSNSFFLVHINMEVVLCIFFSCDISIPDSSTLGIRHWHIFFRYPSEELHGVDVIVSWAGMLGCRDAGSKLWCHPGLLFQRWLSSYLVCKHSNNRFPLKLMAYRHPMSCSSPLPIFPTFPLSLIPFFPTCQFVCLFIYNGIEPRASIYSITKLLPDPKVL